MKNKKNYTDYTKTAAANAEKQVNDTAYYLDTPNESGIQINNTETSITEPVKMEENSDNVVFENNIPLIKVEDLGYKARVLAEKLNFRQEPKTDEDNIMCVLDKDAIIRVINNEPDDEFVFAEYEDKTGLVFGGYVMKKFIERICDCE